MSSIFEWEWDVVDTLLFDEADMRLMKVCIDLVFVEWVWRYARPSSH